MGAPDYTYQEMLREYARISTSLKPEALNCKTIGELENIANRLKDKNYPLACYYAGVAIANFINDPDIGCDMLNAAISGISMIQDFFNISDEE